MISAPQGLGVPIPVPVTGATSATGQILANETNVSITANTNILSSNITIPAYGIVAVYFTTNTSGVLSAVINGVTATINQGGTLNTGTWYEFVMYAGQGMTLNFQFSASATVSLIVVFIPLA